MSVFVDYAALKRATSIEWVANWLGLKIKKVGSQLRGECPVTGGGERALVITPAQDVFFCHSPKCRKGGDLLELIAHVRQISTRDAALSLQEHLYPQGDLQELEYVMPETESVQALGVPVHVAKALGIGYAPRGTMAGRICFPLRDRRGKLVAYLGYSAGEEQPVKLPKRFFL